MIPPRRSMPDLEHQDRAANVAPADNGEPLATRIEPQDIDDDSRTARKHAGTGTSREHPGRTTQRAARPLLRSPVAKEIIITAPLDPYLTLKAAAEYSGISVRALRAALTEPMHPLPCYRPGGRGGKVLVRRSEFDAWMAHFRAVGDPDLDAIVNEVMKDLA